MTLGAQKCNNKIHLSNQKQNKDKTEEQGQNGNPQEPTEHRS